MSPVEIQPQLALFEKTLAEHFAHRREEAKGDLALFEAIHYSLFNGGKRFRPQVCLAVGTAMGLAPSVLVPLAMAIECVHTYSLIHDDLPCMDNDDFRRGQPTSHRKFGEDVALLAGDSLLTEAFLMLARAYPQQSPYLIEELGRAAGGSGMILGQILDLGKGEQIQSLEDLIRLHELKTGQLIGVCFSGPAILAGKRPQELFELGLQLGLAFQVKDDLLDAEEAEPTSFINFLGVEGTQNYLQALTERLHRQTAELGLTGADVLALIDFNFQRSH